VKKLLLIAWHELTGRFADPVMLLLAIAVPLGIAALISLAFGDVVLGAGIPEGKVPVGIVNQDRGNRWGNIGEAVLGTIIPEQETPALSAFSDWRLDLFEVRRIEDQAQARDMVDRGKLTAALLIPPDFSEGLAAGQSTVAVYVNGGESILGIAFGRAAAIVANAIATGQVTLRTTVKALARNPRLRTEMEHGMLDESLADLALRAAMPESNPIQVQRVSDGNSPVRLKLTHFLAATIAIMFVSFMALIISASLLQEKAQWTLQRMYLTPTRPGIILGGKTLGAYLSSLIHMGVLVAGMAALERLLNRVSEGGTGINLAGLVLLILAVVAAATGFGMAVAGLARTYAGAANYGRALLVLMGLVGGVFFPVDLLPLPINVLSRLTFHYWAMEGYLELARGGSVLGVLPHVAVLAAMGLAFFAAGHWSLRRQLAS